jgi:V/A-type H+-transporting ATPase subunit I
VTFLPSPADLRPVRMRRIAVVAPASDVRKVLVRIAGSGLVELDEPGNGVGEAGLSRQARTVKPVLAADRPDPAELAREGRLDLLAGEAQLERHAAAAVRHDDVMGLTGWCPAGQVSTVAKEVRGLGAAVVPLPPPRGVDPPTLLAPHGELGESFGALVSTYGTVPYRDLDPRLPAGIAYAVMFGMMFGDAGDGVLLLVAALLLRAGVPRRWTNARRYWPFAAAAAITSTVFGVLYGEFFGPTGVLPALWISPLKEPVRLLAVSLGVGAVLLSSAYVLGAVNRWREGGPRRALYSSTGAGGAAVFFGLGLLGVGYYLRVPAVGGIGGFLALAGIALCTAGFFVETPGGAAGAAETGIHLFDLIIRLSTNLVSFVRLAAFGIAHAALAAVVWESTVALAKSPLGTVLAALVFVAGNALAFALEGLAAAIQALRLEFYELFSRVFDTEGRRFRPWSLEVV